MIINCPKCGEPLDLPEEACENGARIECYNCSARSTYNNGQLFLPAQRIATRIPLPANVGLQKNAYTSTIRQMKLQSAKNGVGESRIQELLTKPVLICASLALAIACIVVVLFMSYSGGNESGDSMRGVSEDREQPSTEKPDVEERVEKPEAHGIQQRKPEAKRPTKRKVPPRVKQIERELQEYRSAAKELKGKLSQSNAEECKKKLREFEKRLQNAGYMVSQRQYSEDHRLQYLVIVNVRNGNYGMMQPGLAEGSFNYPSWMPQGDAKEVWKHYYYDAPTAIDGAFKGAYEECQKKIAELEEELEALKHE